MIDGLTRTILEQRDNIENQRNRELNSNKEHYIKKLEEENTELKKQQKEFIKYTSDTIEELETDDVGNEELKGYLIQRIDDFKQILSKYKEIIGSDKE